MPAKRTKAKVDPRAGIFDAAGRYICRTWECPACLCYNPTAKTECEECHAPRSEAPALQVAV
jgi:hypothetical protein